MCDNDKDCKCSSHAVAVQSLDEMDFERGICCAAQYGDLERVRKILKEKGGADLKDSSGYTALHYASRNGHLEVCQMLLENGANVNAVTNGGVTALCRAAATGKEEIVRYLLSNNADPFLTDSDGKTALHRAAENKHYNICRELLKVVPSLSEISDNRGTKVDLKLIKDKSVLFR